MSTIDLLSAFACGLATASAAYQFAPLGNHKLAVILTVLAILNGAFVLQAVLR